MNWSLLFVGILAFNLQLSLGDANSFVMELTDATFSEYIEKNPIIMVLFYAPWCGKSKEFLPEYEKAAKLIHSIKKPFVLAKLDASSETETADKLNIQMFPVIKLFLNKTSIDYDKEHNADAVLRFIERAIRPPSVEIIHKDEIKAVKEAKGFKCLLLGGDEKNLEEHIKTAKAIKDFPFYHMGEKMAKEEFADVKTFPAFVLLKAGKEEKAVLTGNLTKANVEEFVQYNTFPLISGISQEILGQVLKPFGRIGIVLFRADADKKTKGIDQEFQKLAETHKSIKYLFIKSDVRGGIQEKAAKYVGVDETRVPILVIWEKKEDLRRYEYKGEFSAEEMGKFLVAFKEGKVQRTMKTEDEPAENKGPVYKVVGKTFERDVLENNMDIFVKFYATWCGHCKSLAPIYESMAKKLSANKNLKIVEIDVPSNEISGHNVQSFPTLKLFAGNNKREPITYEGPRTEEAMIDFLKKNCFHKIEVPVTEAKKQ